MSAGTEQRKLAAGVSLKTRRRSASRNASIACERSDLPHRKEIR